MIILNRLLSFIFPTKCAFCGEKINERYTCRKCLNIIEYYHERVDISTNEAILCDKIISVIPYYGFMKKKILQYKFQNAKYMAPVFAEILLAKIKKHNLRCDLIVAVPISNKRLKERGYNQSDLIARYLSNFAKIQYKKDVIIKIKNNLRQSELDIHERKENVKDAYSIKNIEIVNGKKVVLIDDIYTTGATLNECAKVLKNAGAKEVVGLTVMYGRLEN